MILGAGVTGLAAARATGLPVYEASQAPGGICRSYYMRPGRRGRLDRAPADGGAYRFEIGGGHWIFGGGARSLGLLRKLSTMKRYARRASVYFPKKNSYVPYPLQNHLEHLGSAAAAKARAEMKIRAARAPRTLRAWLGSRFGPTLCGLFFYPFHDLYTAGIDRVVAPQDAYKNPVRGRLGYNAGFLYPEGGLDLLARRLAAPCRVRYGKRAVRIDAAKKEVRFADGSRVRYETLFSTLPLNQTLRLAGARVPGRTDPYTSVLVLNIGAVRGPKCPDDHWLYLPGSRSGFHRVGFYSNVDRSFLPRGRRGEGRVSLYVERAFAGGRKPSSAAAARYAKEAVRELREWGFIEDVEVFDPTWIDVAYTWERPGSSWKARAAEKLASLGIRTLGRYGRWTFQGIAESVEEGLAAGNAR